MFGTGSGAVRLLRRFAFVNQAEVRVDVLAEGGIDARSIDELDPKWKVRFRDVQLEQRQHSLVHRLARVDEQVEVGRRSGGAAGTGTVCQDARTG